MKEDGVFFIIGTSVHEVTIAQFRHEIIPPCQVKLRSNSKVGINREFLGASASACLNLVEVGYITTH